MHDCTNVTIRRVSSLSLSLQDVSGTKHRPTEALADGFSLASNMFRGGSISTADAQTASRCAFRSRPCHPAAPCLAGGRSCAQRCTIGYRRVCSHCLGIGWTENGERTTRLKKMRSLAGLGRENGRPVARACDSTSTRPLCRMNLCTPLQLGRETEVDMRRAGLPRAQSAAV